MSSSATTQCKIEGTVSPGFESVKRLYAHNMASLVEKNTQLCIYHNGELVVDLWASAIDDPTFSADSLVNVFSSGKSLEAIAMASLVDKELLDYNARITDYWPEFGAAGKHQLTVAELMRHEAGLSSFEVSLHPESLHPENIKKNAVGKVIEDHEQSFPETGSREYHAITRGWIVNEVFRRVDPLGRTIGQFYREELSKALNIDVIIGLKEEELERVSPVEMLGIKFQLRQSLTPAFLGRKIENNLFQLSARILRMLPAARKMRTRKTPSPFEGMDKISFFNEPVIAMGETPSAAANCSARGLAKLAAMMSMGGKLDNITYLGEAAWQAMHAAPVTENMLFTDTTFTQGGVALFSETNHSSTKAEKALNAGREGFYGWMGLGGSIFQWHPEKRIGFGYVPTSLNVLDLVNERGKTYQAEVMKCIANLENE